MSNELFYPAMYYSWDRGSVSGHRSFRTANRVRLLALFVAAVGGAASWRTGEVDLFGVLGLVSFAVALATGAYLLTIDPEKLWYEARTATESTKTLAWRYAVGGNPFPGTLPAREADERLVARLTAVAASLDTVAEPGRDDTNELITEPMRKLRAAPFDERKAAYLRDRVVAQEGWYRDTARADARRFRTLTSVAIALEFAGLTGAGLKAFGVLDVDLLGVFGAAAAGLAAWIQAQRYAETTRSYTTTYRELGLVKAHLAAVAEDRWPGFVEDAEATVTREHSLWRATKGLA
ncbi:DUF4231 domain-containing protein [Actinoplanes solisilvae]|uniref:DUF4231 domain-containing protein n=1 Tax=Actinoplanes solisilvae TaxID=2486853 RepID=UPI0013E28A6C|nr:DUF4231 domain-containing protein [Actinoplanes solisilvae]